jgi:hypothetical protein
MVGADRYLYLLMRNCIKIKEIHLLSAVMFVKMYEGESIPCNRPNDADCIPFRLGTSIVVMDHVVRTIPRG